MAITARAEKFIELYVGGLKLMEEGNDEAGERQLYEAAKLSPEAWLTLANQLAKDKQIEPALARFHEVLKLSKNYKVRSAAYMNIGAIIAGQGDPDASMEYFRLARQEWPNAPDNYSNLALVFQWKQNWPEALRYCDEALKRDPWHEQATFIRAMCLLLSGDYRPGWEDYECRWRSKGNNLRKIECDSPEWDGANGKRVYIYGEQGHGDSILMLRYARMIRERGMQQIWVAHKGLEPLMKTIPEIDRVVLVGESVTDFDCHLPGLSLPRLLGTTIETIPPSPYLTRPEPFKYGSGFHVGIVWRGSTIQSNDHLRSTNLDWWKPVLSVPGVIFHSLQVDNADEALVWPSIDSSIKPTDWLDTASKVCGLDLVISVDTSIVHLCGALGVPCWVAMHVRPYFVYPPAFETTTPWYSSLKLYRQTKANEWAPVFERMSHDLRAIAG